MNYLFWYPWDRHMTRALRAVFPAHREQLVVATGVWNLGSWWVRRGIEQALRRLRTDYLDVFQILWLGRGRLSERVYDVLLEARREGKIRWIGISTHVRSYAAELVRQGKLDVVMVRYNAAHRGAEQEVFPYVAASNPGVVAYTATRWGRLLKRPKGWPESERLATAGDCYRFVLTNPHVHVCLTAPRNEAQLRENLAALERGPMSDDELAFMRRLGDVVHAQNRWFL